MPMIRLRLLLGGVASAEPNESDESDDEEYEEALLMAGCEEGRSKLGDGMGAVGGS